MSAVIDDGFFAELLSDESENLLRAYAGFLKNGGSGQAINRVAQHITIKNLIFQIKNLLNLVSVLNHLDFKKSISPLLLERDLLLLELQLMEDAQSNLNVHFERGRQNPTLLRPIASAPIRTNNFEDMGPGHKEIADFITGYERVQNTEVFKKFPNIARRTMKRKLSELVGAGAIKRFAEGKKVFYCRPV